MVGDLNPREEREKRNERANQGFEKRNERANQGFVGVLNLREEWASFFHFFREKRNERANQGFLVDLNPRGEMANILHFFSLVDLNPNGGMANILQFFSLVDLNPRGEMANILHFFSLVDLNPNGGMANILQFFSMVDLNPRGEMANILHFFSLVDLNPRGEMANILHFFSEKRNERANQRFLVDLNPNGGMANILHFFSWDDLIEAAQMAIHDVVASDEKMIVDKQGFHPNCSRSCHGTKLMKSSLSLATFFLPCAGGTGHGPPEYKGHSEIYQSTLHIVSNCPSPREYMERSIAKCVDVCGSFMLDGNCAYHCMRDSSKTKLVEFCAKPEILFEYCPEYDPVDQTIQKDLVTLCNSKYSRNYYNSSDIYFCDPENCLQLYQSSERSGSTTLTMLMNKTTEMNDGDSQEWYIPLLTCAGGLIVIILIGCIFWVFYKRRRFSGNPSRTREMAKKRNRNEIKYERHTRIIEV